MTLMVQTHLLSVTLEIESTDNLMKLVSTWATYNMAIGMQTANNIAIQFTDDIVE